MSVKHEQCKYYLTCQCHRNAVLLFNKIYSIRSVGGEHFLILIFIQRIVIINESDSRLELILSKWYFYYNTLAVSLLERLLSTNIVFH